MSPRSGGTGALAALRTAVVTGPLHTMDEWLRLNGSHILAAILVFAVQPGLELPPLLLKLFSA